MKTCRNHISHGYAQRGVAAVMVTFMLVAIVGIVALAIDIGRIMVARNEMQNAADAAALAGAAYLIPSYPHPNWGTAEAQGRAAIGLNSVDGVRLADGIVTSGFWDLRGTQETLKPQDTSPSENDKPAVKVVIEKKEGVNGGPLALLFAPVLDVFTHSLKATAVAVISGPGYVGPEVPFPFVIDECLYRNYWNTGTGQPDPPGETFRVGSGHYHGTCEATGMWSSLGVADNSASYIKGLLEHGATGDPLHVGDPVYVQPGVEASLYKDTERNGWVCSDVSAWDCGSLPSRCKIAWVPVVPCAAKECEKTWQPVRALAPVLITDYSQGQKWFEMHFLANCRVPDSGGSGTYYGGYVPPRLAY